MDTYIAVVGVGNIPNFYSILVMIAIDLISHSIDYYLIALDKVKLEKIFPLFQFQTKSSIWEK